MAVTNFIWDVLSDNVLMETDVNDVVVVDYTTKPDQFGEVVSQHQHSNNHYYNFDGLGSTRNLTSQNQAVTDSYTYTAFGETVASSGSTPNPFQFNGKYGYYSNSETNDFYVRRRSYRPMIARWISRDPLGLLDGPNVYVYVRNLVPDSVDPTGKIIHVTYDVFQSELFPNDCSKPQTAVHHLTTGNVGEFCWWIQLVEVHCITYDCIGDCHATCDTEPNSQGVLRFWEAQPFDVNIPFLFHTFRLFVQSGLCGHVHGVATMEIYCGQDIDEYIRALFVEQVFDQEGNPTIPLPLPSSCGTDSETFGGPWYLETGEDLPFMKNPPAEGPVFYGLAVDYNCCPGTREFVDPQPEPD